MKALFVHCFVLSCCAFLLCASGLTSICDAAITDPVNNTAQIVTAIALDSINTFKNQKNARDEDIAAADDPHAGHDHAEEAGHDEDIAAADDPHADHDHGEEPGHDEDVATADDPHAGHDYGEEAKYDEDVAAADDPHAGHDHGAESEAVGIELSPAILKELGITTSTAGSGRLLKTFSFPGVIAVNDDHLAHIKSRVPGSVVQVNTRLGDTVKPGDVLAILDSRELADAKASYLAAMEKSALEESNFAREENIFKKNISTEKDYLNAKQIMAEARIATRSARQKLIALGLRSNDIARIPEQPDESLTRFEIRAPFTGTVIEKHISLGETIREDDDNASFVIADLSTVWVTLQIFQQDLPWIVKGRHVTVSPGSGIPAIEGIIDYVGPVIDHETRTAAARIVITNTAGMYRPGLFVTAIVTADSFFVPVCIPKQAIQTIENEPNIFVKGLHGFEPRLVRVGRSDSSRTEILSGLKPGDVFVSQGAFDLKAHMLTSNMDPHAGHGH